MKKTKLLSLLTSAAVVAVTLGTFAAWDVTERTTTNEVSLSYRNPIVISEVAITNGDMTSMEMGSENTATIPLIISGELTNKKIKVETVDSAGTPVTIPTGITVNYSLGTETIPTEGIAATASGTINAKVSVAGDADYDTVKTFTSFKVKVTLV